MRRVRIQNQKEKTSRRRVEEEPASEVLDRAAGSRSEALELLGELEELLEGIDEALRLVAA
jgi:hypothetical protein